MAKKSKKTKNNSKVQVEEKKESVSKTKLADKMPKNIDIMKTLKFVIPVVFILFVIFMAFHLRSGPINLDGIDDRVRANVYSNIQAAISQNIAVNYPNLNAQYREEMVAEEYNKVIETGKYTLNGQELDVEELARQSAANVKAAFKADNGQTYLNAIDPYHFLKLSENYQKNGHLGTELKENENGELQPYISYKVAPVGVFTTYNPEFHILLESFLFNLYGVDENSDIGEKTEAVFLIPVIFAMLSVIPIYLILRKFTDDLSALFGSLILISLSTFVSRTVAGFVDTDAYNVFFPLMIMIFLVYGFLFKNDILTGVFAAIAGLFQALFILAWSNGWYMFIFIVASLLGYVAYTLAASFLYEKKFNLKKISNSIKNSSLTLVSFLVSSFIFTFLITSQNIFTLTYNSLLGYSSAISSISQTYIWPNVLSSVAELNPASFPTIIASVGGTIVFFIALMGLVLLALDYKIKYDEFKMYNRLAIGFALIWYFLFVFQNLLISLTANNALMYIVLLFLPLGIAVLFRMYNGDYDSKVFLLFLLTTWIAGTIFMSLNGVRFILLMAPAFAIAFALGMFYISKIINDFLSREFKLTSPIKSKVGGLALVLVLFLVLYNPIYTTASNISNGVTPNFDDAWYNSMQKIKDNSKEDAIITSWWDFGHFFATVSGRGVTFDGASQTTPRSHWVGKLLLEGDEEVSVDILRMLVCGGNEAHDKMIEFTGETGANAVKANKIIYSTFGKSKADTRTIIENNEYFSFTDEQVDIIMENLKCDSPPENFVVTSEDMVGKTPVWAHWGSWDFTKKYVHDSYKTKSAEVIAGEIDEEVDLIDSYITELKTIDFRATQEDIKRESLINQWFAPYPGYVPIEGSYWHNCLETNASLLCLNGAVRIDLSDGTIQIPDQVPLSVRRLVYPSAMGGVNTVTHDEDGDLDIILRGVNGQNQIMFAQTPLGESLFTKTFYLDGSPLEYFDKFDDVNSVSGVRVVVWKVNWEKFDNRFNSGSVSSINLGNVTLSEEDLDLITQE